MGRGPNTNTRNLGIFFQEKVKQKIGPLQVVFHVVQNRRAGEQKSHWDKTNKRHT